MPPKFTFTNGFLARGLLRCTASAISSFPVPLSPVISTEALVREIRLMVSSTSIKALLLPIMWLRSNPSSSFFCSSSFFLLFSSRAVSMRCIKAALFQGFVMKSKAPACIPLTASWMLPQAVIRITGVSGWKIFTCFRRVMPSSPVVVSEKFMSIKISSGATERTTAIASLGEATAWTSYLARFSIKLSEVRIALSSSITSIIGYKCRNYFLIMASKSASMLVFFSKSQRVRLLN